MVVWQSGQLTLESGTALLNSGTFSIESISVVAPAAAPENPLPLLENTGTLHILPGLDLDIVDVRFKNSGWVNLYNLGGFFPAKLTFTRGVGEHEGTVNLASGSSFTIRNSGPGAHEFKTGTRFQGEGHLILGSGGAIQIRFNEIAIVDRLVVPPIPGFVPGPNSRIFGNGIGANGLPLGGGRMDIVKQFEWGEGSIEGVNVVTAAGSTLTTTANNVVAYGTLSVQGAGTLGGTIKLQNGALIAVNGGQVTIPVDTLIDIPADPANAPYGVVIQNGGTLTTLAGLAGGDNAPPTSMARWHNLGGTVIINGTTLLKNGYYQTAGETILNGDLDVDGKSLGSYDNVLLTGGTLTINDSRSLRLGNGAGSIRLKFSSVLNSAGENGYIDGDLINDAGTVVVGGDGTIGRLHVGGSYEQSGGLLLIDLGGSQAGNLVSDMLYVEEQAFLGGKLRVGGSIGNPPSPASQVYTFLSTTPGMLDGVLPDGTPYQYPRVHPQFSTVESTLQVFGVEVDAAYGVDTVSLHVTIW